MSILHKFILGLIALMCLLQLAEMSRIRRDDTAAVGQPGQPGSMDIAGTIESLMEKFKGLVDEEKLKEILNSAADALTEGAKKLKEQIK